MNIKTEDGIIIFCLPDCARCKVCGKSPVEIDECPLHKFDVNGDKCVPELCEEYEE